VATVVEGAGDSVREARSEFPATGESGVGVGGGGHAAYFRAAAPSVHTLSEISANRRARKLITQGKSEGG
jgi:hypothetical protein